MTKQNSKQQIEIEFRSRFSKKKYKRLQRFLKK